MTTDQKQDEAAAGMLAEMNDQANYPAVWQMTAADIRKHMKDKRTLDNLLSVEGVDLLEYLVKKRGSLRSVARMTGLSPTYLSQVMRSKVYISHGAFLKLVKLYEDAKR